MGSQVNPDQAARVPFWNTHIHVMSTATCSNRTELELELRIYAFGQLSAFPRANLNRQSLRESWNFFWANRDIEISRFRDFEISHQPPRDTQ